MNDRQGKIIEKMCDKIVEDQKATYRGTLEPFEVYAQRMKKQLQNECQQYLEQLRHGYDSIMNKITSEEKSVR
jgi:hypothetical protein